jgi:hypothetical protein
MRSAGFARTLSFFLASILCATPCGFAQTPQPRTPDKARTTGSDAATTELKIRVLEGGNVVNSIASGQSIAPVIEVRDQNDMPVEGATVVFTLPQSGPGGTFPGGSSSFTVLSNAQGQATCPFRANGLPGKFKIKVAATVGTRSGEIDFTQTNSTAAYAGRLLPSRPLYKRWYFWAIIGGAAAAGLTIWATKGGSSTASTTTVVITPGGPVFSVPH